MKHYVFKYGWVISPTTSKRFVAMCETLQATLQADTLEKILEKIEEREKLQDGLLTI